MLDGKKLEEWRRLILRRLQTFKALALQTKQYMSANKLSKLEDKNRITSAWQRIEGLFPNDFQPERAGDLSRHLRFAHVHDFSDIVEFDLPAVEESVRRYGRRGQPFIEEELNALSADFETWELLHLQIMDAAKAKFDNGMYRDAAQAAIEFIMDELRRLTGRDADGDALIRSVIGTQTGKLGFSPCTDNNEKKVTEGYKLMLQGLYKGIRNPASHGWDGFSPLQTFQILVTCSLLLSRLQVVEGENQDD